MKTFRKSLNNCLVNDNAFTIEYIKAAAQVGNSELQHALGDLVQAVSKAQHRKTWAMAIEAAANHVEQGTSLRVPIIYTFCKTESFCIRNLSCPPLESKGSEE